MMVGGIRVFAFASADDGVEQHIHIFRHSNCESQFLLSESDY